MLVLGKGRGGSLPFSDLLLRALLPTKAAHTLSRLDVGRGSRKDARPGRRGESRARSGPRGGGHMVGKEEGRDGVEKYPKEEGGCTGLVMTSWAQLPTTCF